MYQGNLPRRGSLCFYVFYEWPYKTVTSINLTFLGSSRSLSWCRDAGTWLTPRRRSRSCPRASPTSTSPRCWPSWGGRRSTAVSIDYQRPSCSILPNQRPLCSLLTNHRPPCSLLTNHRPPCSLMTNHRRDHGVQGGAGVGQGGVRPQGGGANIREHEVSPP